MNERWIPFHTPSIGEEEIAAVGETLRSGWLTTGSRVREFEAQFARRVGAKYAVATNSGTAALHIALEALGVGAGDEVMVPTMTFAATAEVVHYLGAKPVLIDCESVTLNLDLNALDHAITSRTKAIVPVHFGGHPCEMDQIRDLAQRHQLAVVEDAAHAFQAQYRDRQIGGISDVTCFSFYATKSLTTGEGGMATTDNAARANHMRCMTLHGITKDAWNRYTAAGSWFYEIQFPGFKYNMTDISAAIGLVQLEKSDQFLIARTEIAAIYSAAFADLPELHCPRAETHVDHAWHLYVIQLELSRLRISRNEFIDALKKENVGASVHFIPLHLHPYYRDTFGHRSEDFPQASAVFDRIVSLPIYPKMAQEDVQAVIRAVRTVVAQYRR